MGVTAFIPSGIKSIQRGTVTIAAGAASGTAAIAAVTLAKTEIRFLGSTTIGAETHWSARVALTNATTVTATRDNPGSGVTSAVSFEVTEWY